MKHIIQFKIFATVFVLLMSLASFNSEAAEARLLQVEATREKVVFQVSDSIPGKWNLTLNNVRNIQNAIGKDKVDIEIVAYGPGINMLKLKSKVGSKIDKALADGIRIVACKNTMKHMKLTVANMLPSIAYVPSGAVELMRKQEDGWAYIRP